MTKLEIIKEAGLVGEGDRKIATEGQLLYNIWHMTYIVCSSYSEFYEATEKKIMLDTELATECLKHLTHDLSEDCCFIYNLYQTARNHFKCGNEEVCRKSFQYINPNYENLYPINSIPEAIELLEVIDGKIMLPVKWYSPEIYAKIGKLIKTFDFERIKQGKRVGFAARGEFQAKETIAMLLQLKGISLSDNFDYYPTPEKLVNRVQTLANIHENDIILEPSAGNGNLLQGLPNQGIVCIELSTVLAEILKAKGYLTRNMKFEDFKTPPEFHKIIMNPPFGNRLDAKHIYKAFTEHLKVRGILVAIHSTGIINAEDRHSRLYQKLYRENGRHRETYDNQEFKDSGKGTNINVAISVFEKTKETESEQKQGELF